jgi:hypothetical protein
VVVVVVGGSQRRHADVDAYCSERDVLDGLGGSREDSSIGVVGGEEEEIHHWRKEEMEMEEVEDVSRLLLRKEAFLTYH